MPLDPTRGIYAATVPQVTAPNSVTAVQGNVRLCGWSLRDAADPAAPVENAPANPAAGAGYQLVNGTAQPWALLSVKFTLTTSAAVANRFVSVQIRDGGGATVAENSDLTAVTASQALTMFLAAGLPNIPNAASGTVLGAVPAVPVQPGWSININVSAEDAADQLSSIVIVYQPAGQPAVAHILDGGQVLGVSVPASADTQWLDDAGTQAGSGVSVQAITGSVLGCVYVIDVDPGTQLA